MCPRSQMVWIREPVHVSSIDRKYDITNKRQSPSSSRRAIHLLLQSTIIVSIDDERIDHFHFAFGLRFLPAHLVKWEPVFSVDSP